MGRGDGPNVELNILEKVRGAVLLFIRYFLYKKKNDFYVKKSITFFDIKNSFFYLKNSFLDIKKSISWYQEIRLILYQLM